MREPDRTVMFGIQDAEIEDTPRGVFSSNEIKICVTKSENGLIFADYTYESEPAFGSGTEAEGEVIFDKQTDLVAITKRYDRPKERSIFEKMENAMGAEFRTPDLKPEDEHEIYRNYGFDSVNGYTISFKQNSKEFDVHSNMGKTLDPEAEATQRVKHSNKRISDELVHEIAEEAMEDGMYVWSCDLVIDDYTVGYSDPIRFTRITDEFVEDLGFQKLFEIAREAIQ